MKLLNRLLIILCTCVSSLVNADDLLSIYLQSLENDPELKAAQASFLAKKEAMPKARAGLMPNISATARVASERAENIAPGSSPRDFNTRGFGIELTQPVFRLERWFQFQQGKMLSEQAQAEFSAAQQNHMVTVIEAYFDVLRKVSNLRSAMAEETAIKRQLDQANQRFEVGLVAVTDVNEARANFDLSKVTRIAMQGDLRTSYRKLTVLTGVNHREISTLDKAFPVRFADPIDNVEWSAMAMENNFQLEATRLAAQASLANYRAKRAEFLPKLDARIRYDRNVSGDTNQLSDITGSSSAVDPFAALRAQDPLLADTLQGVLNPFIGGAGDTTQRDKIRNSRYSATLNLTVPIFSGGMLSANSREANQQYNEAQQRFFIMRNNLLEETESLHSTVNTNVLLVNARRLSIESAQSALEANQLGYQVGTRNIVDVLQAQRMLFSAKKDYQQARYDYIISLCKLKQAAGIMSPEDIYELNRWLERDDEPLSALLSTSASQYQIIEQAQKAQTNIGG